MRSFGKNVFRLTLKNRGSFFGAVIIIAIGIFVMVSMFDTMRNLEDQINAYYDNSRMADIFAEVSGISPSELKSLEEIPGIRAASGKMSKDVRLLGKNDREIVTVHLMSYSPDTEVNRLKLSADSPASDAIWLGNRMAGYYKPQEGEEISLLCGGRRFRYSYAGSVSAPNYIYSIPPGGSMVPDGSLYDLACIPEKAMEDLLGKSDSLNELGFLLEDGYRYEDVSTILREKLTPCGLISLTKRENQVSQNMVNGELVQLVSVGTVLPVVFMAVSVFMLWVVLKKRVERDESLIGTMKAFGMTDRELVLPYLCEGAVSGVAGALIGCAAAVPFGQYMFDLYVDYFTLPDTVYHNYLPSRAAGLLIAAGTGLFAAWLGVRGILKVNPAQAMRSGAPPVSFRYKIPDRLLMKYGTFTRMGLRSVTRNPFRGFLIALAVAFPFAMTSVLFAYMPAVEDTFYAQFEKAQIYDLQVSFDRNDTPLRIRQALEAYPEVSRADPVYRAAIRVSYYNQSEFAMLTALPENTEIWKIYDNQGKYHKPPSDGIILNRRTASKLGARKGSLVKVSIPGYTVRDITVPVSGVIGEAMGGDSYISLESFSGWFSAGAPANMAVLSLRPGESAETMKRTLTDSGRVTSVTDTRRILKSYMDMMGSMAAMMNGFSMMAVIAGAILIYNVSMINVRERSREFGTLFVLGASQREIGKMVLLEQAVYFAAGMLLGIPFSRALRGLMNSLIVSDSYDIYFAVPWFCYVEGFFVCLIMMAATAGLELRFISKTELTEVLKERE